MEWRPWSESREKWSLYPGDYEEERGFEMQVKELVATVVLPLISWIRKNDTACSSRFLRVRSPCLKVAGSKSGGPVTGVACPDAQTVVAIRSDQILGSWRWAGQSSPTPLSVRDLIMGGKRAGWGGRRTQGSRNRLNRQCLSPGTVIGERRGVGVE